MELKLSLVFEWLRHGLRRISFKSHRDTSKERLRIRLLVRVNPSGETKKVDILGGGSAFGAPPHLPSGEMSAHSKGFFSSLFGGSLKKGKGDKAACSYPALKSVGLAAPETVVDGEGDSESDDKSFGVIQSNCYMAFNVSTVVSTVMQKGF